MTAPRLSVIVPTYNRRQRLGRVLDALGSQTVSPEIFEVVVIDDGSTDGTRDWLARQTFPFEVRTLSQSNAGPAVARNTGIRAARGELLVFLDDDVVPVPQWLDEHVRTHDIAPGDIVVLGPLSSLPRYDQPWVAWEQVQVEKQYAAMERGDWEPTYRQFWTGNASVSRARVLEAGLFDAECLRGEDVELGWRLAQRGVGFRFNPRAQGFHHAERSLEQVEEWARRRGIRSAVSESVASRALTNVRERFSELAMSVEQSYRMSLLGMRHSVDLIRLIRELAVLADDRDLREWSERWSLRRLDLLEQAEMALGWFAEHPGRALEPVKSTLVAQVARTMLKAVSEPSSMAPSSKQCSVSRMMVSASACMASSSSTELLVRAAVSISRSRSRRPELVTRSSLRR